FLRAGIVGVFLGQLAEVAALIQFLLHFLRPLFRLGIGAVLGGNQDVLHLDADKLIGLVVFLLQILFLHLFLKVRGNLAAVDEKFPELLLVEPPLLQAFLEGFFLRLGLQIVLDLLHHFVGLLGVGLILLHLRGNHPLADQLFHQLLFRFGVVQEERDVGLH